MDVYPWVTALSREVAVLQAKSVEVAGIRLDALARVLCELGRVEHLAELGSNGPLVASAGAYSLFHCLFGRDSIRMATDLLDDFPSVAHATIVELARLQGVDDNARREEEPGRIVHEFRHPDDPHAVRLRASGWDFPYYGTVDATPQWIRLLGAYCQRHGPAILNESLTDRSWRTITLRDSLLAALVWIVRRMDDPSGGGYVWVRRSNPHGIPNQVWEDSSDSHYHADGQLFDVRKPYAPVAVQAYAYDALLVGAQLLSGPSDLQLPFEPEWLHERAARLRSNLLREFWLPDLGTFAQALTFDPPGSTHAARVVASAAGHLLDSRILGGEDARPQREQLMDRLTRSDLVAGAGIRTKSTTAARFRAGSYHNGSTWPMDTGIIADGLRRWGQTHAADDLERRILRACAQTGTFPEFFRGDPDGSIAINTQTIDAIVDGTPNRLEQPPQANQGWTATRVWRILRQHGLSIAPGTESPVAV
jgi:glycogen debranching enzyme